MNKQRDEILEEEINFCHKRAGCLLILGLLAVEAIAIPISVAYYLKNKENDKTTEPTKVLDHTHLQNAAGISIHTR